MKSVRKTALPAHQLQYFSNPCANKAFLRTDYFCLELIYYGTLDETLPNALIKFVIFALY